MEFIGRWLHTLVTCIAQPKCDPCRGRYLAKFRSHGTWDIWRVLRNGIDGFPFYLNSIICNLEWRVGFFFFLSLFFKEDNFALFCWYNLNSWEFWLGSSRGMNGGIGTVIAGEYSWQKWMSVPEMGDWQARYAWASKWWIYEGWRPVDGKYHFRSGCTIRHSSK